MNLKVFLRLVYFIESKVCGRIGDCGDLLSRGLYGLTGSSPVILYFMVNKIDWYNINLIYGILL